MVSVYRGGGYVQVTGAKVRASWELSEAARGDPCPLMQAFCGLARMKVASTFQTRPPHSIFTFTTFFNTHRIIDLSSGRLAIRTARDMSP